MILSKEKLLRAGYDLKLKLEKALGVRLLSSSLTSYCDRGNGVFEWIARPP